MVRLGPSEVMLCAAGEHIRALGTGSGASPNLSLLGPVQGFCTRVKTKVDTSWHFLYGLCLFAPVRGCIFLRVTAERFHLQGTCGLGCGPALPFFLLAP